ncbi:MAG TPA: HNH endonuclease [Caldilineaceae bacterium]|nr:HNH endonuclease [Caldilineaceae bacterium]
MSSYLSVELRKRLEELDNGQCVYCQTRTDNTGQALTIDHVIPLAKGGGNGLENLCRACRSCNEAKRDQTHAIDPLTGEIVRLYHPRQQRWSEHFAWDHTGVHLLGLTVIGRATVVALDVNNELILFARRRWVNAGWHPPHSEQRV